MKIIFLIALISFTFTSNANSICDAHKMPTRSGAFFLTADQINQSMIDMAVAFQVKVNAHTTCPNNVNDLEVIQLLKEKTSQLTTAANDPKLSADERGKASKELSKYQQVLKSKEKSINKLKTFLSTSCKIPVSLNSVKDETFQKCLSALKKHMKLEVKQYPTITTTKLPLNEAQLAVNKAKVGYVEFDIKILEGLIIPATKEGTTELEQAPSAIGILKKKIGDSEFFGSDTNLLLDVLESKSAKTAIFRNKLKVLERNSRVMIDLMSKQIPVNENGTFDCTYEDEKDKDEKNKGRLKEVCKKVNSLTRKLDRTLKLSYEDSWFENKNIENDIKGIETLLTELEQAYKGGESNEIKYINYLNHANQYLEKYNSTGRFNIGLGVSIFTAPGPSSAQPFTLDLSQFSAQGVEEQTIQTSLNISSGKEVSPIVVATMPYFDATLTLPSYSRSGTTQSSINVWELEPEDGQTQRAFLSQTTIQSKFKVSYDFNLTLKVLELIRNKCTYYCFRFNRFFDVSNGEIGIGVGTTDLKLTNTYTTDIREQIDLSNGFAQLPNAYQLTETENIDHSMMYIYAGGHYYLADQIRLEIYYKKYKDNYRNGAIELSNTENFGLNVSYLFF